MLLKVKNSSFVFFFLSLQLGHFRVHPSLHFKARLSAKSLLRKSVFIHVEIRTNYHNKNFALRLTLKERLRGTRKWPIWPSSSPAKSNSRGILSEVPAAFLLWCTESYDHEVGFSFP